MAIRAIATTYVSGVLETQDGGTGSYFTGTWTKHPDAGGSNGLLAGSLDTPGLTPDPTGDRAGSNGDLWGCCYSHANSPCLCRQHDRRRRHGLDVVLGQFR